MNDFSDWLLPIMIQFLNLGHGDGSNCLSMEMDPTFVEPKGSLSKEIQNSEHQLARAPFKALEATL